MNIIVSIHKGAPNPASLQMRMQHMSEISDRFIPFVNSDCSGEIRNWFPSTVLFDGPGQNEHHGLHQCRRHLAMFDLAAQQPGITAVLDPDAWILEPFSVPSGVLAGSQLFDIFNPVDNGRMFPSYVATWFVHPPYVADQETWKRLADAFRKLISTGRVVEEGHQDRVLARAAELCSPPIPLIQIGKSKVTAPCYHIAAGAIDGTIKVINQGHRSIHMIPTATGLIEPALDAVERLKSVPPEYDYSNGWKWKRTYDYSMSEYVYAGHEWETDKFHISFLPLILANIKMHRASGSLVVVEVGAFTGGTTVALIDMIKRGVVAKLVIIEPNVTRKLQRLIEMSGVAGKIEVISDKSYWQTNIDAPDLVMIDGDHDLGAFADVLTALSSQAHTICMHDSRSNEFRKDCAGATAAAKMLKRLPDRDFFEDALDRPGLGTNRGFLASFPAGTDINVLIDHHADEI